MKIHLDENGSNACHYEGKYRTENINRVTCLRCQSRPVFTEKLEAQKIRLESEFQAQTPQRVRSMFGQGNLTCSQCKGDLFRERPRSLFSFHFVCENCGKSMHPPTETGMFQ